MVSQFHPILSIHLRNHYVFSQFDLILVIRLRNHNVVSQKICISGSKHGDGRNSTARLTLVRLTSFLLKINKNSTESMFAALENPLYYLISTSYSQRKICTTYFYLFSQHFNGFGTFRGISTIGYLAPIIYRPPLVAKKN